MEKGGKQRTASVPPLAPSTSLLMLAIEACKAFAIIEDIACKKKIEGKWEKERKEYFARLGWEVEEIEDKRDKEKMRGEEMVERDKSLQRKNRWKKLGKAKFNKIYVVGHSIPRICFTLRTNIILRSYCNHKSSIYNSLFR
ncbi:hypothetical protein PUN28_003649 [Cardiocondyla obscurior]|uniref:Uncharacterized protein n=1 Tax=Cardiocondyla obscurior TaxID=286306 RepID=A0AAW2GLA2_9HYME